MKTLNTTQNNTLAYANKIKKLTQRLDHSVPDLPVNN